MVVYKSVLLDTKVNNNKKIYIKCSINIKYKICISFLHTSNFSNYEKIKKYIYIRFAILHDAFSVTTNTHNFHFFFQTKDLFRIEYLFQSQVP